VSPAPRPPRWARWLAAMTVHPGERRFLLDDLEEEFQELAQQQGVGAARRWYRSQVVRSAGPSMRRRISLLMGSSGSSGRLSRDRERRAPADPQWPPEPGGMDRSRLMESLWKDLRYGARSLSASPGYTVVALLTLALGIGANAAIFGIVNPFLFRPLPFQDPERLVQFFSTNPRYGMVGDQLRNSAPTYEEWKRQAESFEALGAYFYSVRNLSGGDGAPERATVGRLTASVPRILGVEAQLGRWFDDGEDRPGENRVVVLSDGLWRRRYGGDEDVIGATLRLDGVAHTVVGVTPPSFVFPFGDVTLWQPAALDASRWDRDDRSILVVGKVAAGVGFDEAEAEIQRITAQLAESHPEAYEGWGVRMVPLREALIFFYDLFSGLLLLLLAAVGIVLLIVCANVANLALSRAAGRVREVAVRAALGAGRLRIVRQLIAENLLLAGAAGIVGLGLARIVILSTGPLVPAALFRVGEVGIDTSVLVYTGFVALVTALAVGVTPALRSARVELATVLREGSGASAGARKRRLARGLVVAPVASAVILCVAAVATIQALRAMTRIDLGFEPEGVLSVQMQLPRGEYPDPAALLAFWDELRQRVTASGQVASAAVVDMLPLDFQEDLVGYDVPGVTEGLETRPEATVLRIGGDYFTTMGIPLLGGRAFTSADTADAPPVVVVNRILAEGVWGRVDVVGETLLLHRGETPTEATVVGVVGDSVGGILFLGGREQVYLPQGQAPSRSNFLVVSSHGGPGPLAGLVRESVWEIDPDLPLGQMRTMEEVVAAAIGPVQVTATLISGFGLFALALAALGVYGVVALSVSRRLREIGIRMALGARGRDVRRLVMMEGGRLVVIGGLVGTALAWGLTLLMASQLQFQEPMSWSVLGTVVVGLGGVAALAAWIPAHRATRVDPVLALRAE